MVFQTVLETTVGTPPTEATCKISKRSHVKFCGQNFDPYGDVAVPFGMAHRGGSGPAPENTEAAFARAVSLGFSHLETDVHLSADGVVVAFHDDELSPAGGDGGTDVGGGHGGPPGGRSGGVVGRPIAELTWPELSEIDLGGGHRIPRLVDLLERFPDARFNIDPKVDEVVDPLIEIIESHEAVDRVCIGSFSEDRIRRVQAALGPRLCTSPGPGGMVKVLGAAIAWPRWRPPYGCLQIPTRAYGLPLTGRWLIGRFHRLGLQVHFWTINDRAEMERLLDNGADALISDNIDELVEVIWSGRAISDSAITSRINAARRAVGDDGFRQAIIATVPRRGIKFVAEVETVSAPLETLRVNQGKQISDVSNDVGSRPTVGVMPFELQGADPELRPLVRVEEIEQPGNVGAVRYGIMCAEDGVVMDDGVTGRLEENRWLMSTTSSGAGAVWEWCENWLQTMHPEWEVHVTPVFASAATK